MFDDTTELDVILIHKIMIRLLDRLIWMQFEFITVKVWQYNWIEFNIDS